MNYGTLQILDELATADNDNVFTYGEDRLYEHVRDIIQAHNAMTEDIVADFVERTTSQVDRFGAEAVTGEMVDIDEWGTPDVQKAEVAGYDIGWPLRKSGYSIGWTRDYFETHTVADMAVQLAAMQAGDIRKIKKRTLDALFRATNYTSIDRLVDNRSIPVKALMNADGTDIPIDQYGNTFDGSTHTHLVGRVGGSVAASDIVSLIDNIVEHGVEGGEVILYINIAQLATIAAFTSNFQEFQAPLLSPGPGSTADIVDGGRKDTPYIVDDRMVGVWDGFVRVWVKPWMPANYYLALLTNSSRRGKVLRLRRRPNSDRGNLRLVYDHEHHPLRARGVEREFGLGVWNRLGAAILYGGGTSYVQPTIAL